VELAVLGAHLAGAKDSAAQLAETLAMAEGRVAMEPMVVCAAVTESMVVTEALAG